MRGKAVSLPRLAKGGRITPAYAGKRHIDSCLKIAIGDHPRLCGEKVEQRNIVIDIIGSPPPMRGKGFLSREPRSSCRITPAYAGKS